MRVVSDKGEKRSKKLAKLNLIVLIQRAGEKLLKISREKIYRRLYIVIYTGRTLNIHTILLSFEFL